VNLVDVNVVVYAHREDAARHDDYRSWLEEAATGLAPLAVSDLVLSGFIRIVTHPRIFDPPTASAVALEQATALRHAEAVHPLRPGARHWSIFTELCQRVGAKGNTVPDAFHAALAIESGSTMITADRGFARFPGLTWRHPLDGNP
jgi:toxin-antitoxin system PIN domain toxin